MAAYLQLAVGDGWPPGAYFGSGFTLHVFGHANNHIWILLSNLLAGYISFLAVVGVGRIYIQHISAAQMIGSNIYREIFTENQPFARDI